jgi:hypothetical protein
VATIFTLRIRFMLETSSLASRHVGDVLGPRTLWTKTAVAAISLVLAVTEPRGKPVVLAPRPILRVWTRLASAFVTRRRRNGFSW